MPDRILFLRFFPYLPIRGSYDLGPWRIERACDYAGPTPGFKQLAEMFMGAFQGSNSAAGSNTPILVHRRRGMDGRLPTRPQRSAIQRAIDLATLDRVQRPGHPNSGLFTPTSDNSELFIWPIGIDGRIALDRGGIVRTTTGGYTITPELKVSAPLELHMPFPFTLDADLVATTYQLLTRRLPEDQDRLRARLGITIDWLSKAWRNSPSIRSEDRVVFLKTGFEALSGTSNGFKCAKWLRNLYERRIGTALSAKYAQDILWSPGEKEKHTRIHDSRTVLLTDLQHWFMSFADVRNDIIHEGRAKTLKHRATAYRGEYVFTGERLLRESIKVCMGDLGYPDIWRSETWRRSKRLVEQGMLAK